MKVEVADLGSPSLTVFMASVDINQHWTCVVLINRHSGENRRVEKKKTFDRCYNEYSNLCWAVCQQEMLLSTTECDVQRPFSSSPALQGVN